MKRLRNLSTTATLSLTVTFAAFVAGMTACGRVETDASRLDGYANEAALQFSADEIAAHQAGVSTILTTAAACLQADLERQQSFFAAHGVSAFYGDRSSFSALSTAGKRQALTQLGKSPSLLDQMEPTSCVGLTLKCLGKGFAAADQTAIWSKVRAFTMANGVDGTAMQHALQKLGWRIYYWNPNPSRNAAWDQAEKNADPTNQLRFWGYHAYRYQTVTGAQHKYFYNFVDNWTSLVGFGTSVPEPFREIPFYVGTAHTGYHVFPGTFGRVIEGHSTRAIDDPQTIESSEFNPLANGGGPRGAYRTGLIAVPPGFAW